MLLGLTLNFVAVKILNKRKPTSLFNFLLIGLLSVETMYLVITMLQYLFSKFLVSLSVLLSNT